MPSYTAADFTVGQHVRVIARAHQDSSRIQVGMTGIVEEIHPDGDFKIQVRFPTGDYSYDGGGEFIESLAAQNLEPVAAPEAEPRTWEMPDEPAGVDVVHTHDAETGAPVIWHRESATSTWRGPWSTEGGSERFYWHELLQRGPVTEGRPAPQYRAGFYRLRGALHVSGARRSSGVRLKITPGSTIALVEPSAVPREWVVMGPDGDRMTVSADSLTRAGAERVDQV